MRMFAQPSLNRHRPAARHHLVERARHPHREALDGPAERHDIRGLDDHVDVVALNGEVNEAEAEPFAASREGALEGAEAAMSAQAPDFPPHAHRDVQGAAAELAALAVRDVLARRLPLAAGALSRAAPAGKGELLLDWFHDSERTRGV